MENEKEGSFEICSLGRWWCVAFAGMDDDWPDIDGSVLSQTHQTNVRVSGYQVSGIRYQASGSRQ